MQAIILAAGMGKRLGEHTRENTKCMVRVNGVPLIDRMLAQLARLPLEKVTIVAGYQGGKLVEHVRRTAPEGMKVEFVMNPVYYKTNNIYSLSLVKELLQENDTLLLESDLICDDRMFGLLLDDPQPDAALVARYESWMDGTMVCMDENGYIVNFVPKEAFDYRNAGQYYKTVNIYKFSREFARNKYVPFLEAYTKAMGNNEYYENVLRVISLLGGRELKGVPVGNLKWYEIDDKQDLDIAEALFATQGDVLRKYYRRYGGYWRFPQMLDFCYLVNPFFPTQRMLDEMGANFATLLTAYPSGMAINTLLASKCWNVKEEYIIPGNGAAELIKLLLEGLEGNLGIVRPTFEEYPNRYDKDRVVAFKPGGPDYRYSADELMAYFGEHPVETLVVVNPDNPSGNFIPQGELLRLAAWCGEKGMRLVVDESFLDFADCGRKATLLRDDLLEAHPHAIVIKSVSKSFGVPGLRLGLLASADTRLVARLKREVPIWNLNSFAEFFMQILTKYTKDYEEAHAKFTEERHRLWDGLQSIGFLRAMPSQANYFLAEVLPPRKAEDIVTTMLERHGILLRDCSRKEGLDGREYLRIAIRDGKDNEKLIKALKTLE